MGNFFLELLEFLKKKKKKIKLPENFGFFFEI